MNWRADLQKIRNNREKADNAAKRAEEKAKKLAQRQEEAENMGILYVVRSMRLTPEELEELQELDEVNEEDENVPTNTVGAVYQEKSLSDFDAASPAVYTCKVLAKSSAYTERTTESSKVFYNQSSVTADVLYVGSAWAIIRYEGEIG